MAWFGLCVVLAAARTKEYFPEMLTGVDPCGSGAAKLFATFPCDKTLPKGELDMSSFSEFGDPK
jgi:hypothetical protein